MPEITVTETQQERLDEIRSELSAAYIDTYGQIRPTDVIQYLLDTYTPPERRTDDAARERIATAEFSILQEIAADVEGVPGSGIDTETMRGELLSTLGVEEFAERLADVDAPEAADTDDSGASAGEPDGDGAETDAAAHSGDQSESDDTGADGADVSTAETASAEASSDSEASGDDDSGTASAVSDGPDSDGSAGSKPSGGPGSVLSAANQLLDEHSDKWREGGGNEPYEVDLPDGTTEEVRTKDDVRGLLFKHY